MRRPTAEELSWGSMTKAQQELEFRLALDVINDFTDLAARALIEIRKVPGGIARAGLALNTDEFDRLVEYLDQWENDE